jgi:hypothetical protein
MLETREYRMSQGVLWLSALGFILCAGLLTAGFERWLSLPRLIVAVLFALSIASLGPLVVRLMGPTRLRLDASGLTLSGGFIWPSKTFAWRDIRGFQVRFGGRGGRYVVFLCSPDVRDSWLMASGVVALPKVWSGPPEDFIASLNAYLCQALSDGRPIP